MLRACCDAPAWAESVSRGRPYADREALLAAGDQAARRLDAEQVDRAVAAHPRLGERPQESSDGWSAQEQAGVGPTAELAEANRAYEQRFGRVFLLCANGLSGQQVLDRLRERLGNDEDSEAAVVAGELRKIAVLRLGRLV